MSESTVFSDPISDLYIGGKWVPASDDGRFGVRDPATDELIVEVANGTVADGIAAVQAAHEAGPSWAATAPRARSEILRKTFELMLQHRDEIAELIVRESGKSWSDATGEVTYAAEFFRWFAEEAVRATSSVQMAPGGDKRILVLLQPVGVAVLVTPWNFPAAMATRKIGPALAAGCTVVLKPASDTPLTALAMGALLAEAGLPPGVVNVVPSRNYDMVGAMLDDPRTRKLSFTGSTHVGKVLLEQAARTVTNCSMELGGNGPFLVFADADLEAAVEGAMVAKMRNAGESCIAANRFYVEASVADEFGARLATAMAALRVGPGLERESDVGPLINARARDEVASLVAASVASGANVLTGGRAPEGVGSYYEPTVLTNVGPSDAILDEEVFGPVAPVVSFETEAEAIEMANRTEYGLAAYVYTADLARALRVSEAIDTGMVGINRGFISDPAAPFGGTKQSGLGREGGHEGLMEFLEQKYLAVDWSQPK
ncbi:MAG: NAD-dependent succinate-semialdehyde dehydrogenase [Acidimicrobiia bacterium]|nr:NAD-dependent succinate-semialdehyde dehydrogenase [Acidimicrobiia bacterium]